MDLHEEDYNGGNGLVKQICSTHDTQEGEGGKKAKKIGKKVISLKRTIQMIESPFTH